MTLYRIVFITLLFLPSFCWAETVMVAVASNFSSPMKVIAHEFEKSTGHKVILTFASSGKIYAQVRNGAPYHIFLSADQTKPKQLIEDGQAVATSQFTYALGTLVLWSKKADFLHNAPATLKNLEFNRLVIANPKLAPYGAAAMEALEAIEVDDHIQKQLIFADNIAQAYQFVDTGNVDIGFIALAQVLSRPETSGGSAWIVPKNLYSPIHQDAVLLKKGENHPAAVALLNYLKNEECQRIIMKYGYEVGHVTVQDEVIEER